MDPTVQRRPRPPERIGDDPRDRLWRQLTGPFCLVHVFSIAGVIALPVRWWYPLAALGCFYVRMFGVTAGYHRYFSHRAYKTSRLFQLLLAFLAETSMQKGVLWWAGHHRAHHRASDTPEDVHSPVQHGLWWAHAGWVLSSRYDHTPEHRIRDFAKLPELRFLSRHHWLPPLACGLACYLLGRRWGDGPGFTAWAFGLSTVMLWHGTFTINSLAHVVGTRRYPTSDDSRNHWLLSVITMGEGWHNNHHRCPSVARQGFYWWELDLSYYLLRLLAALGLVWDLKQPSSEILVEGRALDLGRRRRRPIEI